MPRKHNKAPLRPPPPPGPALANPADVKLVIACILIAVFAAGVFLRLAFLNTTDYRGGADEGYYVRYAAYMAQEPGASIRAIADAYIATPEMHLFPNPLRAGHIIIASLWMRLTNRFDFTSLALMSALFGILGLGVGYLFMRRLFNRNVALTGLILLAASPLNLAMSRRALQDSPVYFFMILAAYLFYEAYTRRSPVRYAAFAFSFAIAMTVKETSVLLAAFFLAFAISERTFYRKDSAILAPAIAVGASVAVAFGAYIAAVGGLNNLIAIAKIIILSPATNDYALRYQSGSFFRYGIDFFLISPLVFIAGAVFCVVYGMGRNGKGEGYRYLIIFFAVLYCLFSFFSKNLRYVMALDLPIRVFAALAITFFSSKAGRYTLALSVAVAGCIAAVDIAIFRHIFLTAGVYDPVTAMLMSAWQKISW